MRRNFFQPIGIYETDSKEKKETDSMCPWHDLKAEKCAEMNVKDYVGFTEPKLQVQGKWLGLEK